MRKIVPSACGTVTTGLCIGLVMLSGAAGAQVIPDGTLPTTVTSPNNLDFAIDGGSRSGNNLFHSFQQFSIPTGGSALFNNAPDIQNIFSRVTGGSVSNIDGLIRTNGSASLFLLNPSGILFGPNASLNIGGSFVTTTANSIQFADGMEFSAANATGTPLLTISVPIGLQMGQNPSPISVQGSGYGVNPYFSPRVTWQGTDPGLQGTPGNTLALVGGALTLSGGYLNTPAGQIVLGSVGANALVTINPSALGWTFNYQGVQNFQDIHLTQSALVDTTSDTGGSIQLQGRQVNLAGSSILQSYTLDANQGRPIIVRANEIINVSNAQIITSLDGNATGTSGNIYVEAPYIRIGETGGLSTAAPGNTGNLTLQGKTVELISPADVRDGLSSISTAMFGEYGQGGRSRLMPRA